MGKSQKFCIFCGGSSLTKEHLWSEWIAPLVPEVRGLDRTESRLILANGRHVEPPIFKDRPGSPITKKFRVVCQACNNTWMSRLEQTVAPLLTPLIKGSRLSILPEGLILLAQWISLKIMVSEHAYDDVVFTSAQRTALRTRRAIPEGLIIRIGITSENVEPVMYFRQAANATAPDEPEPDGRTKNTSLTSFSIGRLFILGFYSDRPRFTFSSDPTRYRELWPGDQNPIEWHPPTQLSHENVREAVSMLNRFILSPKARWRPGSGFNYVGQ